jgi:hypothetical protein
MRQHVGHEERLELQDAAFDGGHLTFDPVAQDGVDGDVALFERFLFVLLPRRAHLVGVRPAMTEDERTSCFS